MPSLAAAMRLPHRESIMLLIDTNRPLLYDNEGVRVGQMALA